MQVEEVPLMAEPAVPVGHSLSSRMANRHEQLAKNTTEVFPIPGWEDMLAVELRVLPYSTIRKVGQRNEKIRDEVLQELYSIADQLVIATEGFYELDGEQRIPLDDDWVSLAKRLPDCPDEATARQAILFLVGEQRIHFLASEWLEWARNTHGDIEKEVSQDFGTTG